MEPTEEEVVAEKKADDDARQEQEEREQFAEAKIESDKIEAEVVNEESKAEEPKKELPVALKQKLIERSRDIREKFNAHLASLNEPTTVSEISEKIGANRMTVAKYIAESMASGNPHNLGIKKLGMYDVIWKKSEEDALSGCIHTPRCDAHKYP